MWSRFVVGVPDLIGTKTYQLLFVGVARIAILIALVWMWSCFRRAIRENKKG